MRVTLFRGSLTLAICGFVLWSIASVSWKIEAQLRIRNPNSERRPKSEVRKGFLDQQSNSAQA